MAAARLLAVNTEINVDREGAHGFDEESVELAHEVLITAWPELAQRVADDDAFLTWRESLRHDTDRWEKAGRDKELLPPQPTLDAAYLWLPQRERELSESERDFLHLGEARLHLRTRLRRVVFASLAVLTAVAFVAAVSAFQQRATANAQRDQAVFSQTSAEAQALKESNTPLAADLNVAAYRMSPASTIAARLISTENTPLSTSLDAGTGAVYGLALSKNGRLMVTSGQGDPLRLWAVTGAGHARLEYSTKPVAGVLDSVALAPDGRLLAVGSTAEAGVGLLNVSDPAHPKYLGALPSKGTASVYSLAFSPDGRLLASGSSDGKIQLWNVTDPADPTPLVGPLTASAAGFARALTFSPDGKVLASGGEDGTVRMWNLANPASPRLLAKVSADGTDAGAAANETGTGSTAVSSVAFSPDGRMLASVDVDDTIELWDIANPADPRPLSQPSAPNTDQVFSVSFSPDGQVFASAGYDGAVRLWNVSDPKIPQPLGQPLIAGTGTVYSVAFGPHGTMLASGSQDGTVRLWSLPQTLVIGPAGPVDATAFSPDKRTLAIASSDGTVRLLDVADPTSPRPLGQLLTVGSRTSEIFSVAISPNGRLLAASNYDGTIGLWDIADPAHPRPLGSGIHAGDQSPVYSVTFSSSGETLAAGDSLGVVQLWDVADPAHPTLSATGRLDGLGQASVQSVAFSPNGRLLASSYSTNLIALWNVSGRAEGKLTGTHFNSGTLDVSSLAFTPDGRMLAAGNADGTVQLWNVTGPAYPSPLGKLSSGSGVNISPVHSVAVSPGGQLLVGGHDDGTVLVWNLTTASSPSDAGQMLLTTDTNRVTAVAFSPGGTLVSGSDDETVRLWNLNVKAAITRVCSLAGSDLTPTQWDVYISQFRYQSPCPA